MSFFMPRSAPRGGPPSMGQQPVRVIPGQPPDKRQKLAPDGTAYVPPVVGNKEKRNLDDFVESFAKDPSVSVYTFDSALNNVERRIIHQACHRWKLFSKSRGAGDSRTLTISKEPLTGAAAETAQMFDPSKEEINTKIKEWLGSSEPTLTLQDNAADYRYLYQLGTTFAFAAEQTDGALVCRKLSEEEQSASFNYSNMFGRKAVSVKSFQSVLDKIKRPPPAACFLECSANDTRALSQLNADPSVQHLQRESDHLTRGVASRSERSHNPIPRPGIEYPVNEAAKASLAAFRQSLPIARAKEQFLDMIKASQVVVLSGETGSGKTTQIPQYVLDGGLLTADRPLVLCTQPRRIAAITVADRVSQERGQRTGQEVGSQVRFNSTTSPGTRLIFMTPGILFRRMQGDGNLNGVGCIIIDEVHERDVFTDFALLVLKKLLVKGEVKIKVILMSATLQASAFVQYLQPCVPTPIPSLNVEGRLFPVKAYFLEDALKWTGFELDSVQNAVKGSAPPQDCHSALSADLSSLAEATQKTGSEAFAAVLPRLKTALKKPYELVEVRDITAMPVTKGERFCVVAKLEVPGEGEWRVVEVHVFRTELGQNTLAKIVTLESSNPALVKPAAAQSAVPLETEALKRKREEEAPLSPSSVTSPTSRMIVAKVHADLIAALIIFFHSSKIDGGILCFLPGMQDIRDVEWALRKYEEVRQLWVLKLHSGLDPSEQRRVFEKSEVAGMRKVVLSTNMAESSVTVSDIVFVIDSGLMKEKNYNPTSNVASLDCQFVSQVNVVQRRGRAGRVREGVAVHLFPAERYSSLVEFPVPELCRTPLEEVCVLVKSLGISDIKGFLGESMDPPHADGVSNAIEFLQRIHVLSEGDAGQDLTALGWLLSQLPLHPHLGRMLVVAALLGVLTPVATIAAAMTQRSPFNMPFDADGQRKLAAARLGFQGRSQVISDHLILYNAVREWSHAPNQRDFAEEKFMSTPALHAIRSTCQQIVPILLQSIGIDRSFADRSSDCEPLIAVCVGMGLYPNVAWKPPPEILKARGLRANHLLAIDGHSVTCGRESAGFRRVALPSTFFAYFERTSMRGTLIAQDATVVSPLPILLACRKVQVVRQSDRAVLRGDDVIEMQCPLQCAGGLAALHSGLRAAVHLAATRRMREVPPAFLQSLVTVLSGQTAVPPTEDEFTPDMLDKAQAQIATPAGVPTAQTTPMLYRSQQSSPVITGQPQLPPRGLYRSVPSAPAPVGLQPQYQQAGLQPRYSIGLPHAAPPHLTVSHYGSGQTPVITRGRLAPPVPARQPGLYQSSPIPNPSPSNPYLARGFMATRPYSGRGGSGVGRGGYH
eukprot:NODE_22_length_4413_cov_46.662466_g19_i0.p1 GENE.NODE_22_length_4413_cov_46.662466_g19_i0~~NODE_22_length_4413_cov_46.662466_g19_i0.p1  ORF type:complete len:1336 (+),score=259.64 NODE_22_length_4413_cov_46.662466_g19_i0:129-4136(+)